MRNVEALAADTNSRFNLRFCLVCEHFLTYQGEAEGLCELTGLVKREDFTCKMFKEAEGDE